MIADSEPRPRFHDLRRKAREQHLELMGIKVDALRKLEKETAKQFVALSDKY